VAREIQAHFAYKKSIFFTIFQYQAIKHQSRAARSWKSNTFPRSKRANGSQGRSTPTKGVPFNSRVRLPRCNFLNFLFKLLCYEQLDPLVRFFRWNPLWLFELCGWL
jgi:hypothetical protein